MNYLYDYLIASDVSLQKVHWIPWIIIVTIIATGSCAYFTKWTVYEDQLDGILGAIVMTFGKSYKGKLNKINFSS